MPQQTTITTITFSTDELTDLAKGNPVRLTDVETDTVEIDVKEPLVVDDEPEPDPSELESSSDLDIQEGTRYWDIAIAMARHPAKYQTYDDLTHVIEENGQASPASQLVSSALSEMYREGYLERDTSGLPYLYRLKEPLRRELAQYDDLNQTEA